MMDVKDEIAPKGSKTGRPLAPEEWKEIKDLLFRGDSVQTVSVKVARTAVVVTNVQKSDSFEHYREIAAAQNAFYKKNREEREKQGMVGAFRYPTPEKAPVAPPVVSPQDRYGKVREFKEKLDDVLMSFILEEIEDKNREIINENRFLKGEVTKLKNQLAELTEPDFAKKLQEKLNGEKKNEEIKQMVTYEN